MLLAPWAAKVVLWHRRRAHFEFPASVVFLVEKRPADFIGRHMFLIVCYDLGTSVAFLFYSLFQNTPVTSARR